MEIYKTFWRRVGALIIDGLVMAPLTGLTVFLSFRGIGFGTYLLLTLLTTVVSLAYYIGMHGRFGQTLGKMAASVRVVTLDDQRISYGVAAMRYLPFILVGVIMSIPMMIYLAHAGVINVQTLGGVPKWPNYINALWMIAQLITVLSNPMRRAIHDFLAGTKVVIIQHSAAPPAPQA